MPILFQSRSLKGTMRLRRRDISLLNSAVDSYGEMSFRFRAIGPQISPSYEYFLAFLCFRHDPTTLIRPVRILLFRFLLTQP
ncbi:unnamed protein product [Microthlaspi erraticum]|uniref:Uncharacterized protein n=1 Tax=Microthlaspi erraticum TaxID=1685480 RepID=A0A6D2KF88_9BRAS|nr:unnamed protein product [Microthlaspi erraticum]